MSRIGNRVLTIPANVEIKQENGIISIKGQKGELRHVIPGVGYKFQLQGNKLIVQAGYSKPVEVEVPAGIEIEVLNNTEINIKGINKELVGEFAANIRKIRKPEPYKGKGIKYKDEKIRRKEGKKAA